MAAGNALTGGESWVITFQDAGAAEEALRGIRSRLAGGGAAASFRESVHYGDEADVPALIALARTPNIMGGCNLFILRRMEKMPAPARRELFAYLEEPSPDSVMVLMFQAGRPVSLPRSIPGKRRLYFPLSRAEAEYRDSFGLGNAMRRGDRLLALKIIDRQCQVANRDFPRLFGIIAWSLRYRVEKAGRLDSRAAALFEKLLSLERGVRSGRVDGRAALELAVIALSEKQR